ncbi:MAG: 4Fe-4S binding protein, partial [Candidatus Krumholzibacteria bacterium]|nr:4Fe-4S binding protein [Candidatus Krumholzibacteria bacterium]
MKGSLACIAAAFVLMAALTTVRAAAQADADEFLPLESSHAVIDSAAPRCADSAQAAPAGRPFFNRQLKWATIAILASIAAGFLVRFKHTRRLRLVFLLASLVVLGFYNGACPCPIQSFMNFVRLAVGKAVSWKSLAYFAGLIPVTYIFGKTWCGWVCHMGALQEFLHLPARFT